MLELGHGTNTVDVFCGCRIYISGDILMVDELHKIPKRHTGQRIDLMLAHGGTLIPSPLAGRLMELLALMITMDAEQGLQLIQLIQPDVTIPIHYDYKAFASPRISGASWRGYWTRVWFWIVGTNIAEL
ncbi:hypothetical protein N7447_006020 [Penicillium robsamsonii]|uniref:uncharacterized protein n=1 Tax=Penicillium robsamsonii TaxID=1792511 RepID=UPI002548CCE3|nr:uncharacterized protein N7447_006020 [Penicillium robsamsonii]KAJ5823680.1 hypothetical protein N7447_006020 [Penicillium robsamsonii]